MKPPRRSKLTDLIYLRVDHETVMWLDELGRANGGSHRATTIRALLRAAMDEQEKAA